MDPTRLSPRTVGVVRLLVIAAVVGVALVWTVIASAEEVIPREASKWAPTLKAEVRRVYGLDQDLAPFFGQVHQESRWRSSAASRYASGMAQFTPGTARDMQRSKEMRDLCGDPAGCPTDPRWALRGLVRFDHDLWVPLAAVKRAKERLAFTLVGYNGGSGWVQKERAKCAADHGSLWVPGSGCDKDRWFGHVSRYCVRAEWACKESRQYPEIILNRWSPLYAAWLAR